MATIKDVARETGLSLSTVSKYINGLPVREKNRVIIKEAIDRLGFKPNVIASALKSCRTKLIGVILPGIANSVYAKLLSVISAELAGIGYGVIFCDSLCAFEKISGEINADEKISQNNNRTEDMCAEFLIERKVDGILTIPLGAESSHLKKIRQYKIPCVLINRKCEDFISDTVIIDNINASYSATERLIEYGHRNIAIIGESENDFSTSERLKGYRRALEDYDIKVRPEFIEYSGGTVEGAKKAYVRIHEGTEHMSAIMICGERTMTGAIFAMYQRNKKIGEDVSVIGFDISEMSGLSDIEISESVQPIEETGRRAVELLMRRINGDNSDFPLSIRMKTKIILTDSVIRI